MDTPETPVLPPKIMRSRGLGFPLDPEVIYRRRRLGLRRDSHKLDAANAVLKTVRPDDTVVELGAGIGYLTALMATKLGVRHLHAFEIDPQLICYMRSVFEANGIAHVTLRHAALGPADGTATCYLRDRTDDAAPTEVKNVEVVNANTLFQRLRPTVLICDIGGAEAALLPAMDLSGLRCAIVELHPHLTGPAGTKAVFNALHAAGLTYSATGSVGRTVTFQRED